MFNLANPLECFLVGFAVGCTLQAFAAFLAYLIHELIFSARIYKLERKAQDALADDPEIW